MRPERPQLHSAGGMTCGMRKGLAHGMVSCPVRALMAHRSVGGMATRGMSTTPDAFFRSCDTNWLGVIVCRKALIKDLATMEDPCEWSLSNAKPVMRRSAGSRRVVTKHRAPTAWSASSERLCLCAAYGLCSIPKRLASDVLPTPGTARFAQCDAFIVDPCQRLASAAVTVGSTRVLTLYCAGRGRFAHGYCAASPPLQ